MSNKHVYECKYCYKTFINEKNYLKHNCKQKEKHTIIKSLIGKRAWFFYEKWLSKQFKPPKNIEVFINSRMFNSFVRFSKYAHDIQIPDVDFFIDFMIYKEIPPHMWRYNEVYLLFIEHFDKTYSTMKWVNVTIEKMFELSDDFKCNVSEIFEYLHPMDLITLIKHRKFSPFVLLLSDKFKHYYIERLNSDQRILLNQLIKIDIWHKKLNNTKEAKTIKKLINEMNL